MIMNTDTYDDTNVEQVPTPLTNLVSKRQHLELRRTKGVILYKESRQLAEMVLSGGHAENPHRIEQAYETLFRAPLQLRLLTLIASYADNVGLVNTEFDKYGWDVMSLIQHLYNH